MRANELYPVLAACLLGSITGVSGVALPGSRPGFSLARRQDDGELEAFSTEKLRKCREPKPIYIKQDNVDWNEINKDKTKLEVTQTTKKDEEDIPAPKDSSQGKSFTVDHVLELQIVVAAFDEKNRKYNEDAEKISNGAWEKANKAVNGGDDCIKVAESITVLDNLLGIAGRVNTGKQVMTTKVLEDRTDTDLDLKKWGDYLKATGAYLEDFKSKIETVADDTGAAIKKFADDDAHIATYFAQFCKDKYKETQDYIKAQDDKQGDGDGDDDDDQDNAQCLPEGSK
ncbi:MAG: hypothetical protein Q9169_006841 [Polycauliona sp. 2 TL-2023]